MLAVTYNLGAMALPPKRVNPIVNTLVYRAQRPTSRALGDQEFLAALDYQRQFPEATVTIFELVVARRQISINGIASLILRWFFA